MYRYVATCAKGDASETNLTLAETHPKILQMFKQLGSGIIHGCRF